MCSQTHHSLPPLLPIVIHKILHGAPPLLNQASTFMCTIKNPHSESLQIIRPIFSSETKAKGGHNGNEIWVCREFMIFNIYVFKRYISFPAFSCVWMIQYLCLVSTGLVLLWQHMHVPVVLAWDCIHTYICFFLIK